MQTTQTHRHAAAGRRLAFLQRNGEYCKCEIAPLANGLSLAVTSSCHPPRVEPVGSEAEAGLRWLMLEMQLRRDGWWSATDPDL